MLVESLSTTSRRHITYTQKPHVPLLWQSGRACGRRYDAAMTQNDQASFAVGKMHEPEVERFVSALDRQGEMDVVQALRGWVRDRLELTAGGTVVDVGCGTGEELLQLANIVGQSGRAIGFDANDPMLETARTRTAGVSNVEIEKAEASVLPCATGSVDALVSERVLQHLQYDPAVAVGEFARVVRVGGRVGLTDTDWSSLQVLVTDDPVATAELDEVRARIPLPFTSNQEAGKHLEEYCAAAGLAVLERQSFILAEFAPAMIQGVRAGLSAAAEQVLEQHELAAANRLLDDALGRDALRIAVRLHAVIARR